MAAGSGAGGCRSHWGQTGRQLRAVGSRPSGSATGWAACRQNSSAGPSVICRTQSAALLRLDDRLERGIQLAVTHTARFGEPARRARWTVRRAEPEAVEPGRPAGRRGRRGIVRLPARRGDRRVVERIERGRAVHQVPVFIGLAAAGCPGSAGDRQRAGAQETGRRRRREGGVEAALQRLVARRRHLRSAPVPEDVRQHGLAPPSGRIRPAEASERRTARRTALRWCSPPRGQWPRAAAGRSPRRVS